jgi:response regulator of citrate/malate metabolism
MRLKDLRKEVEKLKDSKVQYHLFQAIEEYEHGHHLAAALIAGKIAKYTIEQLRALFSTKSDEETAEKLAKALGVKDDDRRLLIEKYLKACKLSRNFFTHDPNAISNASDALSLIADATKLAEWLSLVETKE